MGRPLKEIPKPTDPMWLTTWENFKKMKYVPLLTVTPQEFGAIGDGVANDSLAILAAFNAVRDAGRGIVTFPTGTYLISYGFWIPPNCEVRLNGSRLEAITTFGQGTIPTNCLGAAFFVIGGSITSNGVQSSDYANITIDGGGATLDGNALTQTGTPPGYNGILMETSPSPIEDNFLRLKNINIFDLTVTHMYHYGIYVEGVDNCSLYNVRALYAGANGISVIGGRNITMDTVEASNTRGPNATDSSYGFGFWNEPNNTWQTIENLRYVNCYAEYNYQGGFLAWNPGQDASADIRFKGCKSYRNSWDATIGAHRSAVDASGFSISLATNYAESYAIEFSDCTAIEEFQSGFKVKRGGGGQTNALIRFKNCTAFHCVTDDADGHERAAFSVVGTSNPSSAARVEIDSPTMIAPSGNTAGYMLAALYTQDVFVTNPTFRGPATLNALYSNVPSARFTSTVANAALDPGSDEDTGGITGGATKFFKPIRFASFDQTTEPTDIHLNEMVVWQTDNDVFVGIYLNDDTLKRYVPMINGLPGANQLVKGTPTADGWKQSAVTIDENNVIDNAERINLNGAVDNSGAVVNAVGNISAAGTINSYGLGVPGGSNIERIIMLHDGATADIRSLAAGTGTVRTLRLVVGSTVGLSISSAGVVSITTLGVEQLTISSATNPRLTLTRGSVSFILERDNSLSGFYFYPSPNTGSDAVLKFATPGSGSIFQVDYPNNQCTAGQLAVSAASDATSTTDAPLKSAGGLAVALQAFFGSYIRRSSQTGITASTTQTQGQQPLTKDFNVVSTVANANDVVTLPSAGAGMRIKIRNNGANTLQIFPASGDNINGTGVDASVTLAAGASVTYDTADSTNWYS